HLIARQSLPIQLFTLDTGRLFQETYDLLDKTIARYKVRIQAFFPQAPAVEQLLTEKGPNSFYESVENRKECCFIRKVRADQSENRANLPFAEWDAAHQLIKIHPLLDWSYEQLLDFIKQENIPYNTLHDKGFLSIGCAPCTRAVEVGEDIRAGRWWWEASKKECGLHQETSIKLN
nr:phosphoadenosine phosphosulfate reductase family protein [Flavihumibacter sp.]